MGALLSQMSTYYMQCLQRPEEGIGSPETGVLNSRKLTCGCWESIPGPLEEQLVLLTLEPSRQPPKEWFLKTLLTDMQKEYEDTFDLLRT